MNTFKLLNNKIDRFIVEKKKRLKSLKCLNETFSSSKLKIVDSFNYRFLSDQKI